MLFLRVFAPDSIEFLQCKYIAGKYKDAGFACTCAPSQINNDPVTYVVTVANGQKKAASAKMPEFEKPLADAIVIIEQTKVV